MTQMSNGRQRRIFSDESNGLLNDGAGWGGTIEHSAHACNVVDPTTRGRP